MTQENTVSFKVFLQNTDPNGKPEVRRFGIDRDVVSNFSYLSEKLQSIFPSLRAKRFDVSWKDNDGDDVLISTDDELMIALTEIPGDVRKLFVTIKGDHTKDDFPKHATKHHPGVVCDECENSVNGFRYKCLECINYDLCSDCELKGHHPEHFMIRLPVPVLWKPHFGKRLAHHLAKSVRRCNSTTSSDDCSGPHGDGHEFSCSHHGHDRSWLYNDHQRARITGLMGVLGSFIHNWTKENEEEHPVKKDMNGNGEKVNAEEGVTANGQTQTSPQASTSKSQATYNQDAKVQYLKDVGKAVASFLDPLGVDVDVIVERNKASEKSEEKQSPQENSKKNVTFADETVKKGNETKSDEPIKNEPANLESTSDRESPEKDGWTLVSETETSNQDPPSASEQNVKKEGTAPISNPQIETGNGAGASFNRGTGTGVAMGSASPAVIGAANGAAAGAAAGAATGAYPKNQGFSVFYPPPPSFSQIPAPFPPFNPPVTAPWPLPPPPAPFPLGNMFPANSNGFPPQPKPLLQQQQQQQQQSQQPVLPPLHPDPKINQTIESMMSMGFSNEGGWLTQLVEMKNGDIEKVLDLLQPVKRS